MMIYIQELQSEWPKLRGDVKEWWDDTLEPRWNHTAKLDDRTRQNADDPHEAIERFVSDVMSRGPWVLADAPRIVDGSAAIDSARSPT